MRLSAILVAVALGSAATASAQVTATVTLSADRTSVSTGQPFRLVARADVRGANVERFDMPDLSSFVVRSRQISRPMQIQLGFGQQQQLVTSSTVHTLILEATQPGTVQVPPVTVVAGGQTFTSSPLTLTELPMPLRVWG